MISATFSWIQTSILTSGRYGESFSNNLHNPVFKRGNSTGRLEFRTTRTCASGTTPNVFKYNGIALWTVRNTIFLIFFRPLTKCQQRYSSHGSTPISTISIKKKCKAIPLQAWTGPEGSRRLKLPDFKTIGT